VRGTTAMLIPIHVPSNGCATRILEHEYYFVNIVPISRQ
jgi:hypothetical protein